MGIGYGFAIAMAVAMTGGATMAGDAVKGESDFKKCKSCHSIVASDGTEIVKGGKTGPNLYGARRREKREWSGTKRTSRPT